MFGYDRDSACAAAGYPIAMATHTAPTQNLNTRQKISIHVAAFQPDGETPDTSATLTTSNSSPATCSVAVDPADNRIITITANGAGNSWSSVSPDATTR